MDYKLRPIPDGHTELYREEQSQYVISVTKDSRSNHYVFLNGTLIAYFDNVELAYHALLSLKIALDRILE